MIDYKNRDGAKASWNKSQRGYDFKRTSENYERKIRGLSVTVCEIARRN